MANAPTGFGPNEAAPLPYRGEVPVHRHARRTEAAAAERIAYTADQLRVLAFEEIEKAAKTNKDLGRTLAAKRGVEPNDATARYSMAPRVTELTQLGLVRDSGRTRENAIVWEAVPVAERRPGVSPAHRPRRPKAPKPPQLRPDLAHLVDDLATADRGIADVPGRLRAADAAKARIRSAAEGSRPTDASRWQAEVAVAAYVLGIAIPDRPAAVVAPQPKGGPADAKA